MRKNILLTLLTVLFANQVFGASHFLSGISVVKAGMGDNGGTIKLRISPNTTNCSDSTIHFSDSTDQKDFALRVGLAALLSEKNISVKYTQASDGEPCFGDRVYLFPSSGN